MIRIICLVTVISIGLSYSHGAQASSDFSFKRINFSCGISLRGKWDFEKVSAEVSSYLDEAILEEVFSRAKSVKLKSGVLKHELIRHKGHFFVHKNTDDEPSSDEVSSSTKLAKYLRATSGQDEILLIPSFDGVSVPGFDGIVFDQKGRAIRNLSLKMSKKPDLARREAIKKARHYSLGGGKAWFGAVIGQLTLMSPENGGELLKETVVKYRKLMGLFGVGVPGCRECEFRKTTIVIEVRNKKGNSLVDNPNFWQGHRAIFSQSRDVIESIVYIEGSILSEITNEGDLTVFHLNKNKIVRSKRNGF